MQRRDVVIAAAVILDAEHRMLVVRKRGTDVYMQPGGKIEAGELPLDALRRELREEVNLPLGEVRDLGVFSAPAAHETNANVIAHVFAATSEVEPSAAAEIDALAWLDLADTDRLPLAPLTRDHMVPLARRLAGQIPGELR